MFVITQEKRIRTPHLGTAIETLMSEIQAGEHADDAS